MAARLDAWGYLGSEACNFASPRVNAVRAALFLLYPDGEDASLVVSHFLDFCDGAGVPAEQQRRCLAEAYGHESAEQADGGWHW